MILTISESQAAQWKVRLLFDFRAKSWRLLERPAPPIWDRIGTEKGGTFELVQGGKVMWLWEHPSSGPKRNHMILWDPPTTSQDTARKPGGGTFFAPKDTTLKGVKVQWATTASGDSAGAGDSIRDDVLAMIKRNLPSTPMTYIDPPNWVEPKDHGENTAKNAQGFRSTGCGGLPGKVFAELTAMGWPIPTDVVDGTHPRFTGVNRKPGEKAKPMKLAGSSIGYKFIVQEGVEKRLGTKGKIYISYQTGGRLPLPGDVYVLDIKGTTWNRPVMEGKKIVGTEKVGQFRHVGVVVEVNENYWITADGGQDGPKKSGFGIGLTKRAFDPKTGLVGGMGEKGELDGWIDVEALVGE